ncbi:MAG: exodeoxyribonuclease VII large subunit [Bacteroidales bacterium]|jgi:exodeoxyribonuclease VII large subunit
MTEKVSLTELQMIIRDSLYLALPDMYWVIAEISELKENYAGHCYLELIEKHPDEKNVRARIKAIIWSNRYRFLKAFFENATGESLREGLKILVKTKVEYHELYGLSLVISDIDPAFTIGEMAMKRQFVIKRLEQEGVFSMNKELKFPSVPQRIAIISSKNAAGYSDFINQLKGNSFGYVFYTVLIETSMQGTETEQGVISALDKIALNSQLFDLVVIIRGGGSQSDLNWFDSYNIAYHITQFPLPVITGIGHDKDISVTDMVANRSLKTPTAVADFLIDSVANEENHIIEISSEIIGSSRIIIEKNRNRIETSGVKLFPLARIMMSDIKDLLSGKIIEIINIGKEYTLKAGFIPANQELRLSSSVKSFSSAKEVVLTRNCQNLYNSTINFLNMNNLRLTGFINTLNLLKPENVLQRGYSVTSINGRILKGSDRVKIDDLIDTQLYEGTLKSIVLEKKGRVGEEEKGRK